MMQEAQKLVDDYVAWLRDKTQLRQLNGNWVEITTPHLDRHNDYLQMYVKRRADGLTLSDDGYILADLEQSGCSLKGQKRRALLKMTLAGFGVHERDGRLEVEATSQNFPVRKHNLIQAMLAVNDLFATASATVASLFHEDVVAWLDDADIRYTPNVKFIGLSGYDHMFDFVIPKSRAKPERIITAMNKPSKDTAEAAAFKWIDTKDARSPQSLAYAFLNDKNQQVPAGVVEALRNYEITPIAWSDRQNIRLELAA